jgi:hypothetical protein
MSLSVMRGACLRFLSPYCIVTSMSTLGPWFVAAYHGECDGCGADIDDGDEIRADGEGGYLCRDCGQEAEAEECTVCDVGGIRHFHGREVVEG